ncbi:MAG: hypothetical protein H6916_03915 [Novosphingobium sp.]|uniref:HK97-gp10 family putative phage morphogenesis protein n=1 Tax=Novosphingobium sp. TaxID=1874826 RepID=UPI002601D719|nr:HK97-gp10 family putative phage morphogenesis protein [Novosphingobium sp.]MCP5385948.1 hypothetical protein [Novosphingobium sp.]
MARKVKLQGFRELEASLADLVSKVGGSKATGKNVLKRTLLRAAEPFEADAKANAARLTGNMSENIRTGTRLTRGQTRANKRNGKSYSEVHVGVVGAATGHAAYAHVTGVQNEFGNEHQAAQPFLRPAWDANKEGAIDAIGQALGEEIEKATARAAKKAARRARQ